MDPRMFAQLEEKYQWGMWQQWEGLLSIAVWRIFKLLSIYACA